MFQIGKIKWKYTLSLRIPLIILLLLAGMIPVLIHGAVLVGTFQQNTLEARNKEIQNHSLILSNKMTRSGYLVAETKDQVLDNEINVKADMFNGRITVVDRNFRIIKDTFSLSEGKLNISEEVIKCFQGENSNKYNKEKHYYALTVPVYDSTQDKKIEGVMVVTASTEDILSRTDMMFEKAGFLDVMTFLILLIIIATLVKMLMRPFKEFQRVLNQVAEGDLEEDISSGMYYKEIRDISQSVSMTIDQLKEVDQSRQEFVSNVSHELKTPITSIRVLADSLMGMDEVPVELYKEFMTDISDEIDRESKIIDDLLSLVRMDKSAAEINIAPVTINDLLALILKRLRPIAKKRNIELTLESIREVTADVDEVKLSLALNNLVENAIKYNREDGWVRVILDADHKFFYVKVVDSGIGIPEEFQKQVFDRFYRVDKARSRETGGTGLGLAITRSVVLMHQGAVKLQSKEGEGTTFTVRIPLTYIS